MSVGTITAIPVGQIAIREYAERVGNKHQIYDSDGHADLDRLLTELGGTNEYSDGIDSMHVFGPGKFIIYLSPFTSSVRQRFTIAHELGHYFLHYRYRNIQDEMTFYREGQSQAETQANVFAASLLMPERPFREAYDRENGDPWAMARVFEVSPAAIDVRCRVLKLT